MYRRSDHSDGTARKGTEFTGQSSKLPVEGITNYTRGNGDGDFDILSGSRRDSDIRNTASGTLRTPDNGRERRAGALHNGIIDNNGKNTGNANTTNYTVNFRKNAGDVRADGRGVSRRDGTPSGSERRTAPAPYYGNGGARYGTYGAPYKTGGRAERRTSEMTCGGRRNVAPKKETNIIIIILGKLYGFFLSHPGMRIAVPCFAVCILACIIIPIAVSGAAHTDDEVDIDLSVDTASYADVKDAQEIAGVPAEGYFDTAPDKEVAGSSDNDDGKKEGSSDGENSSAEDPESGDDVTGEDEETKMERNGTESSETEPAEPVVIEETYTVTFMFYDRDPITVISKAATLREILGSTGYYLTDADKTYDDFDTPIDSDRTVYIDRISYGTVTESEEIPYGVQTVEVQTVPRGVTQTQSWGVPGSKDIVYNVEYLNGAEVSREYSYEYIVSYPVDQIDYYGTGGVVYGSDGNAYSYSYCVDVTTTYYNLTGNTASGTQVRNGIAATDPSVIPTGSQIYLTGGSMDIGLISCEDTGVFGNIVDLWMDASNPYYSYFRSAGIAYLTAYILD